MRKTGYRYVLPVCESSSSSSSFALMIKSVSEYMISHCLSVLVDTVPYYYNIGVPAVEPYTPAS